MGRRQKERSRFFIVVWVEIPETSIGKVLWKGVRFPSTPPKENLSWMHTAAESEMTPLGDIRVPRHRFSFNGVDRLRHGISNMKRTTRGQPASVEETEYLQTILNSLSQRDGLNSQETEMF